MIVHFKPGTHYFDWLAPWTSRVARSSVASTAQALAPGVQSNIPGHVPRARCHSWEPQLGAAARTGSRIRLSVNYTIAVGTNGPGRIVRELLHRTTADSLLRPEQDLPVGVDCSTSSSRAYRLSCDRELYGRLVGGVTGLRAMAPYYAPTAEINLDLNNDDRAVFGRCGARHAPNRGPARRRTSAPPIAPHADDAANRSVVNVYVCQGQPTCATGTPRLRAKVAIRSEDPPSAGARQGGVELESSQALRATRRAECPYRTGRSGRRRRCRQTRRRSSKGRTGWRSCGRLA